MFADKQTNAITKFDQDEDWSCSDIKRQIINGTRNESTIYPLITNYNMVFLFIFLMKNGCSMDKYRTFGNL